jgi:hypothetical protein
MWGVPAPSSTIPTVHPATYVPRGANMLRLIFYDSLYAQDYGKFRLQGILHLSFLLAETYSSVRRIPRRTTAHHPAAPPIRLLDP